MIGKPAHPRDVVQPDLFYADGETFDPAQDGARLRAQLDAVRTLMADGQWRTLVQIARCVQAPEASVSARLRDLRKPRFGMHVVVRQRIPDGHGLYRYRVVPLQ